MTILQGTSIIKGYSNKVDVVFYILHVFCVRGVCALETMIRVIKYSF